MRGDHPDQGFPQGTGSPTQEQPGRCSRGRCLNLLRCTGRTAHHRKGCLAPSVIHAEVEKPCPGEARPAAASQTCWALRRPNGAGAAGAAGLLAVAPGGLVLSIHRAKQRPSGSSWATVPPWGEVRKCCSGAQDTEVVNASECTYENVLILLLLS